MIRIPLRPLARILHARETGANPEEIERENLRQRHEVMRDRARGRAQLRLLFLCMCFFSAFTVIGARMGMLAASEPIEPRSASATAAIANGRADIVDRNGRVLATNMLTHALYAQTKDLIDPARVATELAAIFPELDAATLERRLTDGRSFLWVRKVMSPEQMQAVHNIGDPGLLFGPREMRLYPNGSLAAHILGGATFGAEGVDSAEVIGTAGIEKALDARLRDPAQAGTPLELSLDLSVQATIEEVLKTGVMQYEAKGGAVILMDVKTGEIAAMASYPAFDPNDRPNPLADPNAEPGDSVLFNRAVQGVYELGSTFKIFTAAQAIDLGLVNAETQVNTQSLTIGKKPFSEFDNKNYGPTKSVSEVIEVSSNIGTGHLALMIGGDRQKPFLKALGLMDASPIELVEASGARPLVPKKWPDVVTVTASFGHGMSTSPLNLAAAYATLANGGVKVTPTLLRKTDPMEGPRVLSEAAAHDSILMLRRVVTNGTASMAKMDEYAIGGKTGTADKPKKGGGYHKDKVINTFASVFPVENPQYVLIVTLDEPIDRTGPEVRRTAGWTAVPVAAEIVRRSAPLLGLRPAIAPQPLDGLTAVKQ
jgi:cell division protein FtsI (penicillin-binding protein 3)